jgi:hypothetical protein
MDHTPCHRRVSALEQFDCAGLAGPSNPERSRRGVISFRAESRNESLCPLSPGESLHFRNFMVQDSPANACPTLTPSPLRETRLGDKRRKTMDHARDHRLWTMDLTRSAGQLLRPGELLQRRQGTMGYTFLAGNLHTADSKCLSRLRATHL